MTTFFIFPLDFFNNKKIPLPVPGQGGFLSAGSAGSRLSPELRLCVCALMSAPATAWLLAARGRVPCSRSWYGCPLQGGNPRTNQKYIKLTYQLIICSCARCVHASCVRAANQMTRNTLFYMLPSLASYFPKLLSIELPRPMAHGFHHFFPTFYFVACWQVFLCA